MKVLKTTNIEDVKVKGIFSLFDECVINLGHFLFFDSVQLHISSQNSMEANGGTLIILVDFYDDRFNDREDGKLLILQMLARASLRELSLPHLAEEVLANRLLIKEGFTDVVLQHYFNPVKGYAGWLSFCGLDDYYADMLLEMSGKKLSDDEKERVRRSLKCNDIEGITKIYEQVK